jgi:hypothetical protein
MKRTAPILRNLDQEDCRPNHRTDFSASFDRFAVILGASVGACSILELLKRRSGAKLPPPTSGKSDLKKGSTEIALLRPEVFLFFFNLVVIEKLLQL